MEIEFRKPKIEDKELIDKYFNNIKTYNCDRTFGNLYLWGEFYKLDFAIVEDALVVRSRAVTEAGQMAFAYPVTTGDALPVIERIKEYCRSKGIPMVLYEVIAENKEELEARCPGEYEFIEQRDVYDYVYESEKLISLKGKKYHGKRNHINRFMETDWTYEEITSANMDECLKMNEDWCKENGCEDSETKEAEFCVVKRAFRHYSELGLKGGLLRQNGKIIAYSLGEAMNDETFVVHIEKAYSEIQGAYPMINREFAEHEAADYRYINREDDMGLEGLRKAKLSYRPAFLVEKYLAKCKEIH